MRVIAHFVGTEPATTMKTAQLARQIVVNLAVRKERLSPAMEHLAFQILLGTEPVNQLSSARRMTTTEEIAVQRVRSRTATEGAAPRVGLRMITAIRYSTARNSILTKGIASSVYMDMGDATEMRTFSHTLRIA